MTTEVTCFVDCDLVHAAYATTGLIELAKQGHIRLRFALRSRRIVGVRGAFSVWLEVRSPNERRPAKVCLDVHDGAEYVCKASLPACDLYFKANLSDATAQSAGSASGKLRAFGPYFPCRPRADRRLLFRCVGNSYAHLRFRLRGATKKTSVREKLREAASQLRRRRRYLSRKQWEAYESPPNGEWQTGGLLAFFNPTCWEESNDGIRAINEFRAESIIALREVLGPRFAGGFRRSDLAVRKYAAALEDRHYSHDDYLKNLRIAPIAIYTNGLNNCFSWRLIEVLAAGKCIVGERIPNEAGFPLDRSAGIVQCNSAEALAKTVSELDRSPDTIRELQRCAWETYQQRLRPHVRMQAMIAEVQREVFGNQLAPVAT